MKRIARTRLACLVALAVAASRACAHGNDFEMIVAITLEIAKNPKEPGLLLERAEVYRAHGDLATARRDIQAALDIKPDFHPARVRLALVARDEGQLEESLRLLGLVVEAQPNQPFAR